MRVSTMRWGLMSLLVALSSGCGAAIKADEPMQTVKSVDLERYMGRWYELAKIPNRFQSGCVHSTSAEYALMGDGRVSVVNRCVDAEGEADQAEGVARIVDPETRAKLQVSFVSLFGYHFFWGDYWVIGLGENYEYAVVGHPDRKYGWVLAREKFLSDSQWEQVNRILREQGYDPASFEKSRQE